MLNSKMAHAANGDTPRDWSAAKTDRRRDRRHKTVFRVAKLSANDQQGLCVVRNVSSGGAMADVYARFVTGQSVCIALGEDQQITGTIVWVRDQVVGIQFSRRVAINDVLAKPDVLKDGRISRLPRLDVQRPAEMIYGSKIHHVEVCDISQRGLKIMSPRPLVSGDTVMILAEGLRSLRGHVRWWKDGYAGLALNETIAVPELMEWIG
jgi:hypothetical protein